jgi:hypothetical protein
MLLTRELTEQVIGPGMSQTTSPAPDIAGIAVDRHNPWM